MLCGGMGDQGLDQFEVAAALRRHRALKSLDTWRGPDLIGIISPAATPPRTALSSARQTHGMYGLGQDEQTPLPGGVLLQFLHEG
jgi:hypothetical protein